MKQALILFVMAVPCSFCIGGGYHMAQTLTGKLVTEAEAESLVKMAQAQVTGTVWSPGGDSVRMNAKAKVFATLDDEEMAKIKEACSR